MLDIIIKAYRIGYGTEIFITTGPIYTVNA